MKPSWILLTLLTVSAWGQQPETKPAIFKVAPVTQYIYSCDDGWKLQQWTYAKSTETFSCFEGGLCRPSMEYGDVPNGKLYYINGEQTDWKGHPPRCVKSEDRGIGLEGRIPDRFLKYGEPPDHAIDYSYLTRSGLGGNEDEGEPSTFGAPLWAPGTRVLILTKEGAKACDEKNWPTDHGVCSSLAEAAGTLMLREAKASEHGQPVAKVTPPQPCDKFDDCGHMDMTRETIIDSVPNKIDYPKIASIQIRLGTWDIALNPTRKLCGPDNHDTACIDLTLRKIVNHVYENKENCEREEGVRCDSLPMISTGPEHFPMPTYAPIGKPALVDETPELIDCSCPKKHKPCKVSNMPKACRSLLPERSHAVGTAPRGKNPR